MHKVPSLLLATTRFEWRVSSLPNPSILSPILHLFSTCRHCLLHQCPRQTRRRPGGLQTRSRPRLIASTKGLCPQLL